MSLLCDGWSVSGVVVYEVACVARQCMNTAQDMRETSARFLWLVTCAGAGKTEESLIDIEPRVACERLALRKQNQAHI